VAGILENPAILAQQERILRELYPQLAGQASETDRPPVVRPEGTAVRPTSATHEDEEIDLSAMHEESTVESGSVPATADEADSPPAALDPSASRRPSVFRQTTTSTIDSTFSVETIHASPSTNFGADGKWRPPHNRSPAQIERYIKRCMPVLPADAPRASDVLVHAGRRVKINWKTGALDDWALLPPSYRSHRFDPIATAATPSSAATASATSVRSASRLTRSPSQTSSATASASEEGSAEISLVDAAADLTLLPADKSSAASSSKPSPRPRKNRHGSNTTAPAAAAAAAARRPSDLTLHSAVYCF
jgi:hypothetical protein